MSSTNKTLTIELSQYISTDKPTYLVDYNGDMLKIDNAFAKDRDDIATAQNSADGAGRKADANKESIDTLNAQINGDPEDPSDSGLAGKVTDLGGDVDTIEALIGNGTPTTSNQTIIGAINGLEGAIAPREDGADLANSYVVGEQFARGGSVYTALVPLTAGTAFASLTLNTDYKNSDTLVEQIAKVAGDIPTMPTGYLLISHNSVAVTADGTKTVRELMKDASDALIAESADGYAIRPHSAKVTDYPVLGEYQGHILENVIAEFDERFSGLSITSSAGTLGWYHFSSTENSSACNITTIDGTPTITMGNKNSEVPDSGKTVTINYDRYLILT